MSSIAGHPKAIRIAGRRMSQSGSGPIRSPPNGAKGPTPSSSPEDAIGAVHLRAPGDYPRPNAPTEEPHEELHRDHEQDHGRHEKRDDSRKKGMSSEEARLRKMEAPAVLGRGGSGRRMNNTAGVRITQPAGKMA